MLDRSKRDALVDVFAVLLTLVLVKQAVLPFSQLLAGPASTASAMVLASALLWRRQRKWYDLGMRWDVRVKPVVIHSVIALLVIVATALLSRGIASHYFAERTTSGRFDFVAGNLTAYLFVMALVWTHSAFFEEMLYRAFLISRGSELLGGGKLADIAALIALSGFFGYRHYYYQGSQGAVVTGAIGLALGIMYLWFGKRNLLPLIIAHGAVNSISQTQRFLGG
jgi:membrane protease YdiL (CAAX protease family)